MNNDDHYLDLVKKIVLDHIDTTKYAVFLFGSRARQKMDRAADVDVGILGEKPFPIENIIELKNTVEESIVPYNVDFVDFYRADDAFKKIALKNIEIWNKPNFIKLD